jgi:hypothetical protein
MHEAILISGRDMVLIAIPFLVLVVLVLFRLDVIIAAPRKTLRQHRPVGGMNKDGKPVLSDPDGRNPTR